MRPTLRILALILVLMALLVPLAVQAGSGGCPDDPEKMKDCDAVPPPFYVVINRDFEDLDRTGSGCQPIILKNPDCTDCCGEDDDCLPAQAQLEDEVCPMLADRMDWTDVDEVILYEMCCDCATDEDGEWRFHVRNLRPDGTCDYEMGNEGCYEMLPPGTGIDLPTPVIIGGLSIMGLGLLAAGFLVRRRTVQAA